MFKFIQPDQPQQNAYIERYNRMVRYGEQQYLMGNICAILKNFSG